MAARHDSRPAVAAVVVMLLAVLGASPLAAAQLPASTFNLQNSATLDLCLYAYGSASGNRMGASYCQNIDMTIGLSLTVWELKPAAEQPGFFQIRLPLLNMCWGVEGGSSASGAFLTSETCKPAGASGRATQLWKITDLGAGRYSFQCRGTGKCAYSEGFATLEQRTCNPADTWQGLIFRAASFHSPPPPLAALPPTGSNVFFSYISSMSDRCLAAAAQGNGLKLVGCAPTSVLQTFVMMLPTVGDSWATIQQTSTGLCWAAASDALWAPILLETCRQADDPARDRQLFRLVRSGSAYRIQVKASSACVYPLYGNVYQVDCEDYSVDSIFLPSRAPSTRCTVGPVALDQAGTSTVRKDRRELNGNSTVFTYTVRASGGLQGREFVVQVPQSFGANLVGGAGVVGVNGVATGLVTRNGRKFFRWVLPTTPATTTLRYWLRINTRYPSAQGQVALTRSDSPAVQDVMPMCTPGFYPAN